MSLVWQHLLPVLHPAVLPANPVADEALKQKLAALTLPVQSGAAHSAREAGFSGKTYTFESNEVGITSAKLDFTAAHPEIVFQDADGTHHIVCGRGEWVRGRTGFQKRISFLFDSPNQGIAASGAWSDDETFIAKLCFDETPYTITAKFKFTAGQLLIDFEHNLRWGPTKRPQLLGRSPGAGQDDKRG